MRRLFLALSLLLLLPQCVLSQEMRLQVLGSGGPEMGDQRASTSYLVWVDGKSRILIDCGAGSALNFEKAGGNLEDLEAILLTHLHVDHSSDLPAYIKGAFFTDRATDLLVLGPGSGRWFPGTDEFVTRLFSAQGSIYPYLSDFLEGDRSYRIQPRSVAGGWAGSTESGIELECATVVHGSTPALAWRIGDGDSSITISGDFSDQSQRLSELARETDILVCHNAVPEDATGLERDLHAPPSFIGDVAAQAEPGRLVLSHRMKRTLGRESETLKEIKKRFTGPIDFAEDLETFAPLSVED